MGKVMAERNPLKAAARSDLAEDDPFAELTRIMGFDPRKPHHAPARDSEPDPHGIALELERELLGEFALEQERANDPHRDEEAITEPLPPAPTSLTEKERGKEEPLQTSQHEEPAALEDQPIPPRAESMAREQTAAENLDLDAFADVDMDFLDHRQADPHAYSAFPVGEPEDGKEPLVEVEVDDDLALESELSALLETPAVEEPSTFRARSAEKEQTAGNPGPDEPLGETVPATGQENEIAEDKDPFAVLAGLSVEPPAPFSTSHNKTGEAAPDVLREKQDPSAGSLKQYAETTPPPLPGRGEAGLEMETIAIDDPVVPQTGNIDVPEFDYQANAPAADDALDDLDADFDRVLEELTGGAFGPGESSRSAWEHGQTGPRLNDGGRAPSQDGHENRHSEALPPHHDQLVYGSSEHSTHDLLDQDSFDLDVEAALAAEGFDFPEEADEQPPRDRAVRGLWVAGIIGAVALLGGIGAFALSLGGGNGGDDAPAIVRADPEPVKVKPKDPGGTVVPNQNNAVYQRVAGNSGPVEPSQENLLSQSEEPIEIEAAAESPQVPAKLASASAALEPEAGTSRGPDVTPRTLTSGPEAETAVASAPAQPPAEDGDESLPGVQIANSGTKNEDRLAAGSTENDAESAAPLAIEPRVVRTMIVRPDGTLIPRAEAEPVPAEELQEATGPGETQSGMSSASSMPETARPGAGSQAVAGETVASAPGLQETTAPSGQEAETDTGASELVAGVAPSAAGQQIRMPERVPVAPPRPAAQPVEIVGDVSANRNRETATITQTASAAGQAASAAQAAVTAQPASAWSVQIASQPSAEAARASYEELARRYGSLLQGKGVNIVRADIAGKGTYYRVRIPAESRAEAISLCERYKAAGGACFVSQ
jgi:hypothetical protein